MSKPYLIAHIVRGEPAFDIAIKLQIGDEAGWIIPTSGHRAYPYWSVPLDIGSLSSTDAIVHNRIAGKVYWWPPEESIEIPLPPPNHPDHYTTHATPGTGRTDLLSLIPLKPVEPIKRRV